MVPLHSIIHRHLILTGDITGDGRIAKTGSGQLNLEGNNTFTGGLRIADGNVLLGSSALPTTGTTLEIGAGAVLKVTSATPDYSGIMTFDSTSTSLKISVPAGQTYTMAKPYYFANGWNFVQKRRWKTYSERKIGFWRRCYNLWRRSSYWDWRDNR